MLKTLLKKQILGTVKGLVQKSAIKKSNTKKGMILYGILILYLAVVFCGLFFSAMSTLCAPLCELGLGWLYFIYAELMATILAVVFSAFMAQSQLYNAKDNDLLLSLPIPPGYILLCRMIPLYLQNILFELLVLGPAFAAYLISGHGGAALIPGWILIILVLPLFGLVLSCILGFLIALIYSRTKHKQIITVVLSIAFLAAYFYVYSRITEYLSILLAKSVQIGASIRESAPLVYYLGAACEGSALGLVIMLAAVLILFALAYFLLSKTYIGIITGGRSAAKAKYREKKVKAASASRALLRKDVKRFTGSANYLLNGGLGVVFIAVLAVMAVIKGDVIISTFADVSPALVDHMPLLACLAVLMIGSMDMYSAASVSIEGKNIWVLKSLPVDPWDALKAKILLHWLITAPVSIISSAVIAFALKAPPLTAALMVIAPAVSVLLFGELGLMFNLKHPRFDWTNEAYVVKQSMSVALSLFSGWGILIALAGLFFAVRSFMSPALYLLSCIVLMGIADVLLMKWLKSKGSEIFAEL